MKITNLSENLLRRFQINISASELDREQESVVEKLRQTTAIAGHPRGTAPVELVKKLFSSQIMASTTENLTNKAISEVAAENGLLADAKPKIEEIYKPKASKRYTGIKLDDGSVDVIVSWQVEAPPEILDYLNIKVKYSRKINRDEAIDNQLKILQARSSTNSKIDRPAIDSDTLMVDILILDENRNPIYGGSIPNYVFTPKFGDSKYFGDTLNKILIGKSVGDKVEYNHKFAPNHPDAYLRDKDTIVCVELKEVNEAVVPELDDKFAVACGKESLADLKESIGKHWDNSEKANIAQFKRQAVVQKILEANPLPVDQAKVEKIAIANAASHQISKEMLDHEKMAKLKAALFKQAEDDVRLSKILKYVYDKHPSECRMSETDLLNYAAEEAQPGNSGEETLAALRGRHDFANWVNAKQLRKVLDWVVDSAIVEQD